MTVEENVAVVMRFFGEMLDQRKMEIESELFTPDCKRYFPGHQIMGLTHSQVETTTYSSFKTTVHDVFGAGDKVCARITHTVAYTSDIAKYPRFGPVPAAGKTLSWDANVIFRFEESGKIAEEWVARDELGVLQQLGVVPKA